MAVEKSDTDVPMQRDNTRSWVIVSLVIAAVTLAGMFLPWVSGIDFGSFALAGGRVNGWNIRWLSTPVLIGVVLCFGLAFVKARSLRLLGVVVLLCCCVASLIPMISLGVVTLGGAEERFYGVFMIVSEVPLAGFWVTLLGIVGMIVFGVAIGIKTIRTR